LFLFLRADNEWIISKVDGDFERNHVEAKKHPSLAGSTTVIF